MTYSHSDKCGNLGDIPKHAILASVVENLLALENPVPFIYAETHAGRPIYALERGGEWEQGIREFRNRLTQVSAYSNLPSLKPYVEICLSDPPHSGLEYPGSTGMVLQMLKRAGQSYRFFLCDTDSSVCENLMSFFPQWNSIIVCRGNGFDLVRMLDTASLILIDPAYLDTEDDKKSILSILGVLHDKKIPLICWTPRVQTLDTRSAEPVYVSYEKDVSREFASVSVKWAEAKPGEFWGCHIAVSQNLAEIAYNAADQIRKVMGWSP